MEIVNGYVCRDCTDVSMARRFVDPAKPEAGPFGVTAQDDSARNSPAVVFGGRLAELNSNDNAVAGMQQTPDAMMDARPGGRVDFYV